MFKIFNKKTPDDFYRYCLIKRGLSETSIEGYKKVISKFLKTNKVDTKHIENYIVEMRQKKYSYSHIRNTIVALENFMSFLGKKIKLGRMRRPKPIVKDILTEGEVARIIAAGKNLREEVIIAVLAYSGIRNKEFCSLKVKNINLNDGTIRIIAGKGNKDRVAFVSRDCIKLINNYLRDYPRSEDQFLITTLVKGNQYTGWDLRKRVKVIVKRAGIKKRVYPHLFRHSICSHLVAKNCSLVTIQNMLGHTNLNTTAIYIRSFPQKIQAEYAYLVPNYI